MSGELYEILGVSESSTIDEIHTAFRKKAREHHPDMGGNRQTFQQVNAAYEKLLKIRESSKEPILDSSSLQKDAPRSQLTPYSAPTDQRPKPNGQPKPKPEDRSTNGSLKHLLTGKLPLQDQTTYFILVNTLDIFLTYLHLRSGNVEANPIANFFISRWNIIGMIAFKLVIVASVCVIAQIVAIKSLRKASLLLNFGTAFITCVVLYSIWLLAK